MTAVIDERLSCKLHRLVRAERPLPVVDRIGKWQGNWKTCCADKRYICFESNQRNIRWYNRLDFAAMLERNGWTAQSFQFALPRWNEYINGSYESIYDIADSTIPAYMLGVSYDLRVLATKNWIRYVRAGYSYQQAWDIVLSPDE